MGKRNIFVVGHGSGYANWMEGSLTNELKKSDLVVFTGGEDINPSIYGEPPHHSTYFNSNRDSFEIMMFNEARKLNKKIIGICRGAQLICALTGGKLIQDQGNPFSLHKMHTYDGKELKITSLHHQAQYPWILPADEFKVLAWTNNICKFHLNGNNEEMNLPDNKECEIVLYPKINCLGIQGHPEMMLYNKKEKYQLTIYWLRNLLNNFINNNL